MKEWSNLAKVVYARTYSRKQEDGTTETWEQTVDRVIEGNVAKYRDTEYLEANEEERLKFLLLNRKAMPAGRGLWISGTKTQETLGASGLTNCYVLSSEKWENFCIAADMLMLGGGVGMTVENKYTSKLPRIKRGVVITNQETNDADFIVPDSRQGWIALIGKILKCYFVTGKSFSYSCVLVRSAGEPIKGFGGKASGKRPLITFVEKLTTLLGGKEGRLLHPIDAADILCMIGEVVVAGNVRRSALLIQGDPYDKEFLKAKRWDLGNIPTYRAMANFSVNCSDVDDLHPAFWKTYEHGEPFGIVNISLANKYGRIGEEKKDYAVASNPCSEQIMESGGACNLTELFLPNIDNETELYEAARLMYRWAKRVTLEGYHQPLIDGTVKKTHRVGVGITGCLMSKLFNEKTLSNVYKSIKEADVAYSKVLGVGESIRLTTIKPSGSISLLGDVTPGLHPSFSKHYTRRVRFASNDDLIPRLKEAGHLIEPVKRFDGTLDHETLIAEFPCKTPDGTPIADEDWDTWKQLDVVKMAGRAWTDSSASVTVYYKKEEIPRIKEWLQNNLSEVKSISFLCYNDHGFDQAPYEAITEEQYNKQVAKISPLSFDSVEFVDDLLSDLECQSGVCPVR